MDNNEKNNEIKDFLDQWMLKTNASIRYKNIIKSILEKRSVYGVEEFKKIEEWISGISSPFLSTLSNGIPLYRARKINIDEINNGKSGIVINREQISGYNEENSRECPLLLSPAGRNNIAGQSYLYTADSEAAACAEIKSTIKSLISIATFSPTKDLKILDFSQDVSFPDGSSKECGMGIGRFFTKLMMNFSQPVENEEEYLATQIISDYIRKTGIDGIGYRSFYTGGKNYTIFNSHPRIIKFENSKVVIHQYCNSSFWDFSNKRALFTCPQNMEYDENIASQMIDELSKQKG